MLLAPFSFFRLAWVQLRRAFLEPQFGFHGFQSEEMETANDENGSIPSASERLRAYAQKPEAADYVAEFKQLEKLLEGWHALCGGGPSAS